MIRKISHFFMEEEREERERDLENEWWELLLVKT